MIAGNQNLWLNFHHHFLPSFFSIFFQLNNLCLFVCNHGFLEGKPPAGRCFDHSFVSTNAKLLQMWDREWLTTGGGGGRLHVAPRVDREEKRERESESEKSGVEKGRERERENVISGRDKREERVPKTKWVYFACGGATRAKMPFYGQPQLHYAHLSLSLSPPLTQHSMTMTLRVPSVYRTNGELLLKDWAPPSLLPSLLFAAVKLQTSISSSLCRALLFAGTSPLPHASLGSRRTVAIYGDASDVGISKEEKKILSFFTVGEI